MCLSFHVPVQASTAHAKCANVNRDSEQYDSKVKRSFPQSSFLT